MKRNEPTLLTREDLLLPLMEEAAEVAKAASKCLRFGYNRNFPGYGINHRVLAMEIGQLLAVADALDLDNATLELARKHKIRDAEDAKKAYGVHD